MNRPRVVMTCCFVLSLWSGNGLRSATLVEGTLYDGRRSTANLRVGSGQWQVALPQTKFQLQVIGVPAFSGQVWELETDEAGKFGLDSEQVGVVRFPAGARLVASCTLDGVELYSQSMIPSATGLELYVYPLTESTSEVNVFGQLVHEVMEHSVDGEKFKLLKVSIELMFRNSGDHLFVGKRNGAYREIFRVPLPAGAKVTLNRGPLPGQTFKRAGERWMVVDEPIGGQPDLQRDFQRGLVKWSLQYEVPGTQYFTMTYPFAVPPLHIQGQTMGGNVLFRVYVEHQSMELSQSAKFTPFKDPIKDPLQNGSNKMFNVFEPSNPLRAGQSLLVPVEIDNAAVGQISNKALKWHGGLILVCVVSVLAGLILSRKPPPPEVSLAGLSTEELLDRIAELDRRFDAREIGEKEYRRYREVLVQIASEELEGSGSAAKDKGAERADTAVNGTQLSPEARKLLGRIEELDRDGANTPEAIQGRAHLLEALYKALSKAARTDEAKPAGQAEQAKGNPA